MNEFENPEIPPRNFLLHIYPQQSHHQSAKIEGPKEALRRLGEAVITASKLQEGEKHTVLMTPIDGEYYEVEITPVSPDDLDENRLPYAQIGLCWKLDPAMTPTSLMTRIWDLDATIIVFSIGIFLGYLTALYLQS